MCMCTSERPADISALTAVNHLKLNLSKTELLFILGKDGPCISHCRGFHVLAVWNLGVIFNDGLSCTPALLLWPDLADLPSTASTGSGLSSQRMQRNSWFKC